jgi:hypothetical protein
MRNLSSDASFFSSVMSCPILGGRKFRDGGERMAEWTGGVKIVAGKK